MNKNRSQEEIVANILSVVKNEPKKTNIMYAANLSYALLCKYVDKLIGADMIKYRKMERVYELTEKGAVFLEEYAEFVRIKEQLDANRLSLSEKAAYLTMILGSNGSPLDISKIPSYSKKS